VNVNVEKEGVPNTESDDEYRWGDQLFLNNTNTWDWMRVVWLVRPINISRNGLTKTSNCDFQQWLTKIEVCDFLLKSNWLTKITNNDYLQRTSKFDNYGFHLIKMGVVNKV
jgi:hypothetical protein